MFFLFSQITLTIPLLLITLHLSHIFFTEALTFISLSSFVFFATSPTGMDVIHPEPSIPTLYKTQKFYKKNSFMVGKMETDYN